MQPSSESTSTSLEMRNAETTPSNSEQSSLIRQETLRRYSELKEFEREKDELRKALMKMLDEGATIEPGRLTVKIKEQQSKRVSKQVLIDLLGVEETSQLYERIPPKSQRSLTVLRYDLAAVDNRSSGLAHWTHIHSDGIWASSHSPRICLPIWRVAHVSGYGSALRLSPSHTTTACDVQFDEESLRTSAW
jgi:hypothetical protein